MSTPDERPGISAVLVWRDNLDSTVLDLAAVLSGLVADRFEIIVIDRGRGDGMAAELRARAPALPLRIAASSSAACAIARYGLILTSAADGQFDVRELNHLMDAMDQGADVVVGCRPRRAEGLWRRLRRWGLPTPSDHAFRLMRRELAGCGGRSMAAARSHGYHVVEVPVSQHRPNLGSVSGAGSRAA